MARKPKERFVVLDRHYAYDLNKDQKRQLPLGWSGFVPTDIAEDIVDCGAGHFDPEREEQMLEKLKAQQKEQKARDKAAEEKAAAAKKLDDEAAEETSEEETSDEEGSKDDAGSEEESSDENGTDEASNE